MVKSSSCCEKAGLKKGPWTPEEDHKLIAYIEQHGHGSWRALPAKAGLQRCGKSCRLRWANYLRPDIKRGKFSLQEEQNIIQLHALLGNRWSAIAAHLSKRTDNEIKNYWNTHIKKRLTRMGIDPTTHKPINDAANGQSKDAANLSHMAQWESARLEAEARLVKESKLQVQNQLGSSSSSQPILTRLVLNKITPQPPLPPCLDVLKAWQSSWSTSKPSTPTKDNTKMHSMYAMMLATDDLESPTSTLSFPDTILRNSNRNSNTTFGLINQSLPPSSTSTAAHESGIMKEASDSEPWGNTMQSLGDDDIMVAVEAFRSGGGGYNENCTNMEDLHNDNVLVVYVPTENSPEANQGILNNEDGGITNFEEKHYWNNILNFVNDLLPSPASPAF